MVYSDLTNGTNFSDLKTVDNILADSWGSDDACVLKTSGNDQCVSIRCQTLGKYCMIMLKHCIKIGGIIDHDTYNKLNTN